MFVPELGDFSNFLYRQTDRQTHTHTHIHTLSLSLSPPLSLSLSLSIYLIQRTVTSFPRRVQIIFVVGPIRLGFLPILLYFCSILRWIWTRSCLQAEDSRCTAHLLSRAIQICVAFFTCVTHGDPNSSPSDPTRMLLLQLPWWASRSTIIYTRVYFMLCIPMWFVNIIVDTMTVLTTLLKFN